MSLLIYRFAPECLAYMVRLTVGRSSIIRFLCGTVHSEQVPLYDVN